MSSVLICLLFFQLMHISESNNLELQILYWTSGMSLIIQSLYCRAIFASLSGFLLALDGSYHIIWIKLSELLVVNAIQSWPLSRNVDYNGDATMVMQQQQD